MGRQCLRASSRTKPSPAIAGFGRRRQVEFKADGTLIDQNDVLIGGEVNGTTLDEKTYTVPSNQTLKAKAAKGSQFTEVEVDVSNFSCDEVQLTVLGLSATLTRR